jgi:SH3 domain protein
MIWRYLSPLVILLLSTALQAETWYVDDTLYLGFYKSFNGSGKQFTSAPSGTKLTLIEKKNNYSLVRTEKGTEGWVKNKFLVAKPPAVVRIKSLEREAVRAVALAVEVDRLTEENTFLRKEIDSVLALSTVEPTNRETITTLEVVAEPMPTQSPVDQQQLVALKSAIDEALQALQKVTAVEPTTEQITDQPEQSMTAFLFDVSEDGSAPLIAWNNILSILRSMNLLHYALIVAAILVGFTLGLFVLDRRIRRQHGGYRIW